MDPPDADARDGVQVQPREDRNVGEDEEEAGAVELRSLISSSSGGGPRDAPEDDVVVAPSPSSAFRTQTRPAPSSAPSSAGAGGRVAHAKNLAGPNAAGAGERVASMLSNEGIIHGIQRLHLMALQYSAAVAGHVGPPGDAPPPPSAAPPSAGNAPAGSEDSQAKRKKMVLLLMAALFVALIGAVLEKRTAVVAELGVEAGEKAPAHHEHAAEAEAGGGEEEKAHVVSVGGYQPTKTVREFAYVLPGTEDAPPLSAAGGRDYYPIINHFQHRDPTSPYAKTWGSFDFEDPDPEWRGKMRPQPDYAKAANRDVSNSDFPDGAWQKDDAYMKSFLKHAKELVNRTIEAVYAEYGVGIPPDGSVTLTDEQKVHRADFHPFLVKESINSPGGGSYTTKQSMDGMARRFIHHISTGDTFKLVLGGHSAAAGHGAGFNQSYIIEAGHVLEPVFAHLGVEFRAYNFAQGGMGTFQQALAGMDLRGKETDMIMWDSRMTERPEYLVNFFLRQALISGNRAPILMGDKAQLNGFHDIAGASIANQGMGWVPQTVSEMQVKEVPWAAQYLECARGATANCKAHEYTAGCWVEREDFTPPTPQGAIVGGQAGWHPGNRIHKRRGRMIALIVLKSLDYALEKWQELGTKSGSYPIPEEHWHVTEYYKNIRDKAKDVPGCWGNTWRIGQARHLSEMNEEGVGFDDPDVGRELEGDADFWPARLCNLPLQGRSHWGPRWDPMGSSLLSILKPNPKGDRDPNRKNVYLDTPCYNPPDRPAPWTVPPETEPFAPLIGASRRLIFNESQTHLQRASHGPPENRASISEKVRGQASAIKGNTSVTRHLPEDNDDTIVPGYGIQVTWGRPGVCDGSSHHWCDKPCGSGCLMGGAQDNRGMVCFNGLSGWVVFEVKGVKHGFIGARMEAWRSAKDVTVTNGWTEVNNGGEGNYGSQRELYESDILERMGDEIKEDIAAEGDPSRRRLGGGQVCGLVNYSFEWTINNGERHVWDKDEFCKHYTRLNYNLDVIKFMDDESQTGDFELAMRIQSGTGVHGVMCLTHLYWS